MNGTLCQPCRGFFTAPKNSQWDRRTSCHDSYREFEKCAQTTCMLCARIWAQLNSREREQLLLKNPAAKRSPRLSIDYTWSPSRFLAMYFFVGVSPDNFGRELTFFRVEADIATKKCLNRGPWAEKQPGYKEDTSSPTCMLQSKNWLTRCLDNHRCSIREVSVPPTRLVYIPREESGICRLTLRDSFSANVQYLTLSHCWGKGPSLKLTCAQLENFMQEIPLSGLPKTFKDAFEITRKLGYEYLWVDSLCILQDSFEDWRSESAVMANVYCNAVCNIEASDAFDDSEGCHMARDPSIIEPLVVDASGLESHAPGSLFFECEIIQSFLFDNRSTDNGASLENMPLNTRGWVLQERLLSPRILHFTRYGIVWECQCELTWETKSISVNRIKAQSASTEIRRFRALGNDYRDINALIHTWNIIVERYGQTSLTRPSDKLVAISATAKELLASIPPSAKIGCQYLAGLWSPQLVRQLLWTVEQERPGIKKPSVPVDYRAPSWSWASVDGHIKMQGESDEKRKVLVAILDARSIPGGIDPFLQVKGGHITLRGRLWKLNLPEPLPEGFGNLDSFLKNVYKLATQVHWSIDKDIPGIDLSALYLLPLEASYRPYGGARDYKIRGLILTRNSQANNSLRFQRKGTFVAFGRAGKDKVRTPDVEAMMESLKLSKWFINEIEHDPVLLPFSDEDANATLHSCMEIIIL